MKQKAIISILIALFVIIPQIMAIKIGYELIDIEWFMNLDNQTLLIATKPNFTGNVYIAENNNYLLEYAYWQTTDNEINHEIIEAYQVTRTIEIDYNQANWVNRYYPEYMTFAYIDSTEPIDLLPLGYTGTERYVYSLYYLTINEYIEAYYNIHMHRYRLQQTMFNPFQNITEQNNTVW